MKFFLDENLPLSLKSTFVKHSHSAEHVTEVGLRGASDEVIAQYALNNKLVLVTKDLDFGNLMMYPVGSHYGVLILRLPHYFTKEQSAKIVDDFLDKNPSDVLVGAITIIETGRFRMRRFKN